MARLTHPRSLVFLRSVSPSRAIGLVIALSAFAWRLAAGPHPIDDAYITYRQARNLALGSGLVYNPGERVLATSTPLMAVLLAGAGAVLGPARIPEISLGLNALFDSASVLLVIGIARRLRFPLVAQILASSLFGFSPLVIRYSIGGMEAPLAALLTLATIYLFLSARPGLAVLAASLAIWARPDLLAVGGALAGTQAVLRDRRAVRTVLVLGLSIGAMGSVLYGLYGSPLPNSVVAKLAPTYRAPWYTNAVALVYVMGSQPFLSWAGPGALGLHLSQRAVTIVHMFFLLVVASGWLLGLRDLVRREAPAVILGLYPVLVLTTYAALGLRGSLISDWYLPPLLAVWFVPCVRGLWLLIEALGQRARRWMGPGVAVALLAMEFAGFDLGRGVQSSAWVPLSVNREREDLYAQAAEAIRPLLAHGDVVAASEIGALGYFCGCRILDTFGLASPVSLSYYPLPPSNYSANYAIPTDLIIQQRPTYLVSLEIFMRRTLLLDSRFLDSYELVQRFPTTAFNSDGLLIYRLRQAP